MLSSINSRLLFSILLAFSYFFFIINYFSNKQQRESMIARSIVD